MSTEVDLVLGVNTTEVDRGINSLDELTTASKQVATGLTELSKAEDTLQSSGQRLVLKLQDQIATYGMSTDALLRYRSAQQGVLPITESLITELTSLKRATEELQITQSRDVELLAMRTKAEREAAVARDADATAYFAAMNAEIVADEKRVAAAVSFQAFKIRTMAENRAAAIADLDAQEATRIAAQEKEIADTAVFQAFKIRTMTANRAEALRILTEQEETAVKLAEKQAIEEIKWGELSLKTRITQLEQLKLYQANTAITPQKIEQTFGSAAIQDLPNLTHYQQEYAAALAATASAHSINSRATREGAEAADGFRIQTSRATTEAVVLGRELSRGNYSRMAGSFTIFAQALGFAINPITVFGAAVLGLGYAIVKGEVENKKFADSLIMTGNYAGMTAESVNTLAHSLGTATGTIGYAKDAILALASSGKFTAEEIGTITTAAIALEHAAGVPIDATVKRYEQLADAAAKSSRQGLDLTKVVVKQNETTHELITTQIEEIMTLERTGRSQEALKVLTDDLAEVTKNRAAEMEGNIGSLERGWNAVTDAIRNAWAATLDIGKTAGPAQKLADAQGELSAAQSMSGTGYSKFMTGIGQDPVEAARQKVESAQELLKLSQKQTELDAQHTRDEKAGTESLLGLQETDIRHRRTAIGLLETALARDKEREAKLRKTDPDSPLITPEAIAAREVGTRKEFAPAKGAASQMNRIARGTLEETLMPMQTEISAAAKALQEEQKLLKDEYAQGDISLKAYLDDGVNARQEALKRTVQSYDDEIEATKKYIATVNNEADKRQGNAKLLKEIAERQKAIDSAVANDKIANAGDDKAVQAYEDSITKLSIALMKLKGDFGGAAKAEAELKYRLDLKRAAQNEKDGLPSVVKNPQLASEETSKVEELKARFEAQGKIQGQMTQYNLMLQKQSTLEGQIILDVKTGKISELEALKQVGEARLKEVEDLQKVADNLDTVANKIGDPKMIADARAFRLKLDEMAASSDVLAIKINGVVRGPLESFFTDTMSGTKSIGRAFKDMANSIIQDIDRIVAKELATQLLGTGDGGGGGFGGILSGLIGGWMGGGSGIGMTDASGLTAADYGLAGGYAGGGDPPLNKPSLVGERGVELFVPKTPGTVINNDNLKNMLANGGSDKSGDTVNLTQHVTFMVQGTPSRDTQAQIAAATFNAGSRLARRNS